MYQAVEKTLSEIQVAISRMVAIQEGTDRRLTSIESAVGDDKGGLTGRLTKGEGIQMLGRSEIADIDRRVKALEDTAKDANKKIIGALVAACLALAGFVLRTTHIIPS